jgi:DNA-directed RNA polymerase subunit E'/Rpb7
MMPPENLNGSVIYNITYHCKICIPVENTLIIGQIKVINQELIIAINGPIMIFIPKENVDSNYWDIIDGYKNKNNNIKIAIEDYVKVQITDKRINQNDNQIKSIGKLNDFASPEEVNKFFGSKVIKSIETDLEGAAQESYAPIQESDTLENSNTESNFII